MNPKVSVLINNYNYGKYIQLAIDSIFIQNYRNLEIIVYDDGSTDDSLLSIKRYGDNVKVIANPNYGKGHVWNQVNAINLAFEASSGEYIFLLDSDDCFLENKIERVLMIFMEQPDVVMVQHRFHLIDENSLPLPSEKRPFFSGIDILSSIFKSGRLDFFFTQTSGLSFRRSVLEKILPFQEDEFSLVYVDIRLTRSAAFHGKIYSFQDKLGNYRIHTNNHSANLKNPDYFRVFEKQHIDYFNFLCIENGYQKLVVKGKFVSYFKILFLLLTANMTLKEKIQFIFSWYKSFKSNRNAK